MHGDLRPPNIIVDDGLNIVSILDWEWSHTVPAHLFAPPFWLTNREVLGISKDIPSLQYYMTFCTLRSSIISQEKRLYKLPLKELTLFNLWKLHETESLLNAHGLLKPHYFGNIFCDALDRHYYGENAQERMQAFFNLGIRQKELRIIEQKVLELADFEKERLD